MDGDPFFFLPDPVEDLLHDLLRQSFISDHQKGIAVQAFEMGPEDRFKSYHRFVCRWPQ